MHAHKHTHTQIFTTNCFCFLMIQKHTPRSKYNSCFSSFLNQLAIMDTQEAVVTHNPDQGFPLKSKRPLNMGERWENLSLSSTNQAWKTKFSIESNDKYTWLDKATRSGSIRDHLWFLGHQKLTKTLSPDYSSRHKWCYNSFLCKILKCKNS